MYPKKSEKIALTAGDMEFSYNHLVNQITSYTSLFNTSRGERIAIFSENRVEWIYAFYAAWQKDTIPVPIDFMSTPEDVSFILDDCTPSLIFCSDNCKKTLSEALLLSTHQPNVKIFEEINTSSEREGEELQENYNKQDTAVIIYTSGTTGSPKGVMLTFDNLMANIEGITRDVVIYRNTDRVMILLPLHHIFPLMGSMIIPLYAGGTVSIAPSLNPEDIIATLQNNRITLVIGVPRFYNMIMKGIRSKIQSSAVAKMLFALAGKLQMKGFSRLVFGSVHKKFGGSVRYLVCGGAALDQDIARDFGTLGFEVLEGYGMTESAPMITFTRPGTYKPGTAGFALPATKIEIRDKEIVASGRNIMKGYFNREKETADVLKDGWLYTGDLGYLDKSGYLHITGRKKEILVTSNGKNINPEILEQKLLASSPYLKDAGIFLKNDILQVIIVADLLKMKADSIENYDDYFRWEVIDKFNQKQAQYKRLLKFHLTTEELPKTRLGKIQRFKLEEVAAGLARTNREDVEEPEFAEYIAIRDYLEAETGNKIYPNDHLEMDVALDSLAKVTLLVYIENTFGVQIPEDEFLNYHTVLKLSEFVKSKKTRTNFEAINWKEILKEKVHIKLPETRFSLRIFTGISKIFLNLYFRMHGEGQKNIPEGPCIIAPNHQSFFDGFFVASFLRQQVMQRTYVYAKEKHWRKRWLRFLANRNNIILMDINKDLKLSLQKMAAALKKGKNIIIFPEGTRSKDGRMGQFKKTFAILSQELNVPVIPVAISGSYKAMPSGASFPRPFRRISVKFLQPVYPVNDNYDTLTDQVQQKVAGHLN